MTLPKLTPTGMSAGQGTYASADGRFIFVSNVERSVADPKKVRTWTATDTRRVDVYDCLVVAATGATLDAVREGVEKYLVEEKRNGTGPTNAR